MQSGQLPVKRWIRRINCYWIVSSTLDASGLRLSTTSKLSLVNHCNDRCLIPGIPFLCQYLPRCRERIVGHQLKRDSYSHPKLNRSCVANYCMWDECKYQVRANIPQPSRCDQSLAFIPLGFYYWTLKSFIMKKAYPGDSNIAPAPPSLRRLVDTSTSVTALVGTEQCFLSISTRIDTPTLNRRFVASSFRVWLGVSKYRTRAHVTSFRVI